MKPATDLQHESRWPHRLAVVLVCATFPLIWVGGLVTTYDAGMAVPDWPTTYGYNMFLYPWQTWLLGPWDMFIEHGHRLLGALAGMLTIALMVAVWSCDRRPWMRLVSAGALVAVVAQGVLGGTRVLLDARLLAMLHGCLGPLFFALCVALCVFTSRLWLQPAAARPHPGAGELHRWAWATAAVALIQLVVGAQLRHMPLEAAPAMFRLAVFFHLLLAAVLVVHAVRLAWTVCRRHAEQPALRRPALALVALVGLQVLLGSASWIVKYSWPAWFADFGFAAAYTVQARALAPALIVTGHVATGSLILVTAVLVGLRSLRLVARLPSPHPPGWNPPGSERQQLGLQYRSAEPGREARRAGQRVLAATPGFPHRFGFGTHRKPGWSGVPMDPPQSGGKQ